MDSYEQQTKIKEFIENYYDEVFLENIRKGKNFLLIDFNLFSKHNIELSQFLLDDPEKFYEIAKNAINDFEIPKDMNRFNIRFYNFPENQKLPLRDIRSKQLKKLRVFEGVIRKKSDVLFRAVSAKYECPSCANIITLTMLDDSFKEPTRCGCGRKGKFHLLKTEKIDAQSITLEENMEDLDGNTQAKRKQAILKDDLVSPLNEKKLPPGAKIRLIGILKEQPLKTKHGGRSVNSDVVIETIYAETIEDGFTEIKITEDDIKEIKKIAKSDDVYDQFFKSVAPSIWGYDKIKEAITLQLFGGVKRISDDGTITRGDIHILLIGDPGAAKSQILKRIKKIAPKARYTSGKGSSAAGLTATVSKDEFSGAWTLEAGALVLANKGFVMIDEIDKMSKDDRSAMHEALEQQTVSISKANIQTTLNAEATVLAAANPKFSRFDPYDIPAKQIDMPPTLMSRFDLIFPIRDLPNIEKDELLANFLLSKHMPNNATNKKKPPIADELLIKYISYSRQNIFPEMTEEAFGLLSSYYVKIRNSTGGDNKNKPISISPRQIEGMIRLATASAKIRLSKKVTVDDAKRAIDLTQYYLSQVGQDPETGQIDIDRITTGISSSERSKISTLKRIIAELLPNKGDQTPIEEVIIEATKQNIREDDAVNAIEKLKRTGDIFSLRRGKYISRDV